MTPAGYPGPRPDLADPDLAAAHAEQLLAWMRADHPNAWRDVMACLARALDPPPPGAGRGHGGPGAPRHDPTPGTKRHSRSEPRPFPKEAP